MRCFFHFVHAHDRIPDETGIDVPDLEAARYQALEAIREMRKETSPTADEWSGWHMEVADASGQVLLSIPLDALQD